MICHLKGQVHTLEADHVILDVGGVGYQLGCSRKTLDHLKLHEAAFLFTEMVVREDAHLLYGFFSQEERDLYRLLTSVQGVGAKVALSLLSLGSLENLTKALAREDKTYLSQGDGVGPKLAARLVTELKDRVRKLTSFRETLSAVQKTEEPFAIEANEIDTNNLMLQDARDALMALGYRSGEVALALKELEGKVANTQEAIRKGLHLLGKRL
jgi:Holliday junction DNA helicase RuvA